MLDEAISGHDVFPPALASLASPMLVAGLTLERFSTANAGVQTQMDSSRVDMQMPGADADVMLLGTGSALPSYNGMTSLTYLCRF